LGAGLAGLAASICPYWAEVALLRRTVARAPAQRWGRVVVVSSSRLRGLPVPAGFKAGGAASEALDKIFQLSHGFAVDCSFVLWLPLLLTPSRVQIAKCSTSTTHIAMDTTFPCSSIYILPVTSAIWAREPLQLTRRYSDVRSRSEMYITLAFLWLDVAAGTCGSTGAWL
jgi:hypothetical protein